MPIPTSAGRCSCATAWVTLDDRGWRNRALRRRRRWVADQSPADDPVASGVSTSSFRRCFCSSPGWRLPTACRPCTGQRQPCWSNPRIFRPISSRLPEPGRSRSASQRSVSRCSAAAISSASSSRTISMRRSGAPSPCPTSSTRCARRRRWAPLPATSEDPRRRTANVIAINMAFDYPEPAKAQAVMQSYVTQFLRMDNDQIEDQANLTVRFLSEQAAKLQTQVQAYRKSDHPVEGEQWRRSGRRRRHDVHGHRVLHGSDHRPREPEPAAYGAERAEVPPTPRWRKPKPLWPLRNHMYSDSHPDVLQARERVAILKRARQGGGGSQLGRPGADQVEQHCDRPAHGSAEQCDVAGRCIQGPPGRRSGHPRARDAA